jgi:hypothetical protein
MRSDWERLSWGCQCFAAEEDGIEGGRIIDGSTVVSQ